MRALKKLAPFLPLVTENWRKARRGGELIQWVATYENPAQNQWASPEYVRDYAQSAWLQSGSSSTA